MQAWELMQAARLARANSYAPYSRFRVGAALLCEDGTVYTGVNVENASYPMGLCAEHCAVAAAVSAGKRHFSAIAVCGGGEMEALCTPCGKCRQILREFCNDDFRVYCSDGTGGFCAHTLGELLPHSFGPQQLGAR